MGARGVAQGEINWLHTPSIMLDTHYLSLVSLKLHNINNTRVWLDSRIHTIYVQYINGPWFGIFVPGYHDTQYFMSSILDTHCLCLESMIRNIYVWYPWFTIFMSGVLDTQYLYLVLLIHNIYIWYPWYTICHVSTITKTNTLLVFCIPNTKCCLLSKGTKYLCLEPTINLFGLVTMIHNIYVWIKFLCTVDLTPWNFTLYN